MLEPDAILDDVIAFFPPKLLAGKRIVVTAGRRASLSIRSARSPIILPEDGLYAIARAAHEAVADVTLLSGHGTPRRRRRDARRCRDGPFRCMRAVPLRPHRIASSRRPRSPTVT